jgi:hypothetical protein
MLQPGENRIVFRVWADPEPSDGFLFPESECPVSKANPSGKDRLLLADSLELKTGMVRIGPPKTISASGLSTHVAGK